MKERLSGVAAVVLAVAALVAIYVFYTYFFDELQTLKVKHTASIEASNNSTDAFVDEFRGKCPQLAGYLSKDTPCAYTVAGLAIVKNIYASGPKKGKVGYARDMAVQGLAVSEGYLFVSAYSASGQFHSVLWVLDKSDGSFVKTVVLSGTNHVGGLAYDEAHNRLWVSASDMDDDAAAIGCLSLKAIKKYNYDKSLKALRYEKKFALDGLKHASFVTLHNNVLYAGLFDGAADGTLCSYELDANGYLVSASKRKPAKPVQTVSLPSEVQGVTFTGGNVVLSCASGGQGAHLMVYANPPFEELGSLPKDGSLLDLAMPPYLAQTCAQEAGLYVLFEPSANESASDDGLFPADRVLKFDVSDVHAE